MSVSAVARPSPGRGSWFEAPGQAGVGSIVIDRPDDVLNALDAELIEALAMAVRAARACPDLRGLIVRSGKPDTFVAGADLKQLPRASMRELELLSRRFQAVCDELAWLGCPTVAALTGPALGGGCELALACDYRVAIEGPTVRIGQPEVSLGLIPGGGGTQRLPRLVGLARGLELILSGRQLDARRARRLGLLDEVVHPSVLEAAVREWVARPKRPLHRRPRVLRVEEVAELSRLGRVFLYRQARRAVLRRTRGQYPAPLRALEAVATGFEQGMAAGLEVEARAFADLGVSQAAQRLIWVFLETQRRKRGPTPSGLERVGVVGAGFMGSGIAEVAAVGGLSVRLRDVSPEALGRGMGTLRQLVLGSRRFGRVEREQILQRVSGGVDYSGFRRADVVIEAVFEDLELKRTVLAEIEGAVSDEALIGTNTSALPIAEITSRARHPGRVVGLHFFSPAHRMPLLEVVRGPRSSDEAVRTAIALGVRLGKTPIVVGDGPGFYTSRVLGAMLNEATVLLEEGAAVEDVDAAMTAFGFPVGPFVLYDEVGLQVAQHVGATLLRAFGDRFPRVDIVQRLVASGATGRAAGRGFFAWPARSVNPELPAPTRAFSHPEIQQRLVLLFVNEAARCLDEGILQSAADGDVGAILGLGFPPFRGGPFHYADTLSDLVQRLGELANRHGARYAPAPPLLHKDAFFA